MQYRIRRFQTDHIMQDPRLYKLLQTLKATVAEPIMNPGQLDADGNCERMAQRGDPVTYTLLFDLAKAGVDSFRVQYLDYARFFSPEYSN